ncbi:hypothetical protein V5799_012779 [Amblyomma americanum]|uniref:Uncharacterized protein n=1 Tax=Amblyomma americanum TaxID=6943 RepID=A0AAQ4E7P0_AMBAM
MHCNRTRTIKSPAVVQSADRRTSLNGCVTNVEGHSSHWCSCYPRNFAIVSGFQALHKIFKLGGRASVGRIEVLYSLTFLFERLMYCDAALIANTVASS